MPHIKNFTVGPSNLYHGVADFLSECLTNGIAEMSHRSARFTETSKGTIETFRDFFEVPDDYQIFYTYSATEAMEILTRSAVDKKICHVSNGNFGNVWTKTSTKALKEVQKITHDGKKRVEIDEILPEEGTEFLAITANETSTGIAYSPEEISNIRARFPEILLGVDTTSSMGVVQYDFTQADAWFFSVQKALGLPAGLGILIVGPRVWNKGIERESRGEDVGCHHCLSGIAKKMPEKFQTPTTPNVMNIAGLGYICRKLKEDFGTIENLYAKNKEKENKFYDFLDTHSNLSASIDSGRSESVIVAKADPAYLEELHSRLKESGIVVGTGYGGKKKEEIRIANFPVHSLADVENLLEKIGK